MLENSDHPYYTTVKFGINNYLRKNNQNLSCNESLTGLQFMILRWKVAFLNLYSQKVQS